MNNTVSGGHKNVLLQQTYKENTTTLSIYCDFGRETGHIILHSTNVSRETFKLFIETCMKFITYNVIIV